MRGSNSIKMQTTDRFDIRVQGGWKQGPYTLTLNVSLITSQELGTIDNSDFVYKTLNAHSCIFLYFDPCNYEQKLLAVLITCHENYSASGLFSRGGTG